MCPTATTTAFARAALLALATLALTACGSEPKVARGIYHIDPDNPPKWLDAPPQDDEYIYAVGWFVGALYPDENRQHAIDHGRERLAHQLRAEISSETVLHSRNEQSTIQSRTRLKVNDAVENMEQVESWTDVYGLRGEAGQEWVLVRARKF